ncbi:MAG: competence/damage-inducible protein A [Cyclobacteriaceae bacterium]
MRAKALILTIGDEILYGQTLDTNSHWMSGELDKIGIKVIEKRTIGDDKEEILRNFQEATELADIVLITGGLGPTKDDLTKPLLAEFFGSELVLHDEALFEVTQLFQKSGREMTKLNRLQAHLPSNCKKITNQLGTAPGMWFDENDTIYVSMPGVPYEMEQMMTTFILPALADRFVDGVIYHKLIKTIGIPESRLASKIERWENELPENLKLAYLPTYGQVKLRLTSSGENLQKLKLQTNEQIKRLLPLIDKYVFGYDEDEIETVTGRLLRDQNISIGTAESCTGGQLAGLITSVPGSSEYYHGSIISYDNEVKINQLEVPEQLLEKHGAVSEEVVSAMAEGIRKKLNVDVGLATSGVAGPGGGSQEKPVGTIWIAYSDKNKTVTRKLQLTKDRKLNIRFSTIAALNLLRLNILKN